MIYDIGGMAKKLRGMGAEARKAMEDAIERTAEQARTAAIDKITHPHADDKENIRAHISTEYRGMVNGMQVGVVLSNSPHSAFVEFGTGPVGAENHAGISPDIEPSYTTAFYVRNKESKHYGEELINPAGKPYWIYCDYKERFFATSGQPARPYMYPASVAAEPIFYDEVKKAFEELMK